MIIASALDRIKVVWRQRRVRATLLIFAVVLTVALVVLVVLRFTLPPRPDFASVNQSVNEAFTVKLHQTVSSIDTADISMSPKVEGEWSLRASSVLGNDTLVFTPHNAFKAATTYQIQDIQVGRPFGNTHTIGNVTFTTEKAPDLRDEGIAALKDGATIAADSSFTISLQKASNGLRDIQLRISPDIQLTSSIVDDKNYTWRPNEMLGSGQKLDIEIVDVKNDETLLKRHLVVAESPTVAAVSMPTHLKPGDIQKLTFSHPINKESADISFTAKGEGRWESDTSYIFEPKDIEPGKTYEYTIKKGLRSIEGGIAATELKGSFQSVGAVTVTESSPKASGLPRASQKIRFAFDQPVDKESVASRFSVSSGRIASTSWEGNAFSATVVDLGYQQTVTAVIGAGVKNAGFGLPSSAPFKTVFTTEVRVVKYDVPFYRQQYLASCTAASLRMILAHYGTQADDMSIVQRMGYSPRSWDASTNPPTWDDPDEMFVGDINGRLKNGTGAGSDAGPVANAARSYGRNASAVTGVSAGWIAQQLIDNKFVIMFGSWDGTANYTTWTTASGKTIKANLAGHATTVIGVKGEPSNPQGFWVNDPLKGGTAYWSAAAVQQNISLDPYRQAVVVW
jgi:uncharacterized protein YvpB